MKPEKKQLLKDIHQYFVTTSYEGKRFFAKDIKDHFPKLFTPEKYEPKVGEWVLFDGKYATNGMLKFQGYGKITYGLNNSNIWADGFIPAEYYTFYPITPQEVEHRLRKHALEVLGIGDDTEIEGHVEYKGMRDGFLNEGHWEAEYFESQDTLWNVNGRIYSNSKWTKKKQPIPNDISELIVKYGKEELIKILNK